MPNIESSDIPQTAVYWKSSGVDRFGEQKVEAAVEINVRWETTQREILGAEGNSIALDSIAVVSQKIVVKSIMWLGKLVDVASTPIDLREVVQYNEVPDVKGRSFRRTVFLVKHSDELPALV